MLLMPFSVGEIQIRYNRRIADWSSIPSVGRNKPHLQGVAKLNKSEA